MAQFEISRDGGRHRAADAAKSAWRARFSLNVEPAGPVHALISLIGDKTFVRMWAERPATAQQFRAGTAELSQALTGAELKPGDIIVRDGTPPQPAPARAGHFLDQRHMSENSKLAIALHYEKGGNAPVGRRQGRGHDRRQDRGDRQK